VFPVLLTVSLKTYARGSVCASLKRRALGSDCTRDGGSGDCGGGGAQGLRERERLCGARRGRE